MVKSCISGSLKSVSSPEAYYTMVTRKIFTAHKGKQSKTILIAVTVTIKNLGYVCLVRPQCLSKIPSVTHA